MGVRCCWPGPERQIGLCRAGGRALGALLLAIWLGFSVAPAVALAPPPPPGARSASSQWVTLDGRRILELRSVAGAQSLETVANRGSALLQDLAQKGTACRC